MIITHKLSMDLQNRTLQPRLNMVQCDQNTRAIEISLTNEGIAWVPKGIDNVFLRYRKSDGTGGNYDTLPDGTKAWTVEENRICISVVPQMLTAPGLVEAQLVLADGKKCIATFTFQIVVEEDISLGTMKSENYVNWSKWAKDELNSMLEKVKESGDFAGACYVPNVDSEGNLSWTNDAGMENPEPVQIVDMIADKINGDMLQQTMYGNLDMNGFRITAMADPEEVQDAVTKGYVLNLIKNASACNLLDNSDFSNLVAQAGLNGTHGTEAFLADRWGTRYVTAVKHGSYCTLSNTGTSSSAYIYQRKNGVAGKTLTFAVKINCSNQFYLNIRTLDGDTVATKSWPSGSGVFFVSTQIASNIDTVEFRFYPSYLSGGGGSGDLYWAAVYEGEYTDESLPVYQPKSYTAELAECQRYYYRFAANTSSSPAAYGYNYSDTIARLVFNLPTEMRVNPTFIHTAGTYFRIVSSASYADITEITLNSVSGTHAFLYATASGLTAKTPAVMMATGNIFEFSADL